VTSPVYELHGGRTSACKILVGKPEAKTGCIWLKIRTGASSCEHGNEPLDSVKDGEFLD